MTTGEPPHDLNPADMWDMEVTNEGYSLSVYSDSMGIPTIGIGHNLPASGSQAIENLPGNPSYADVLSGTASLTADQVQVLFDNDMSTAISNARGIFPNFDLLPSSVEMALADMSFNLGPGKLSQFIDLQAAIANQDFQAAADAMQDSAWANQVGQRADRDTLLVSMPDLMQFVQDQINEVISNSPDFDAIDAWGAQPTFGPGDYPVPIDDQQVVMNAVESTTVVIGINPYYEFDDPYAVADESGQPEEDNDGDGFSGGGPGDSSAPTGSYADSGNSYGGEFGAEGGGDDSTGWGGGQAGEGEAGGQFAGGEGGYDGEGGYGGYGEADDEGGDDGGGE